MSGGVDPLLDWLYSLKGPQLKWDLDTARAFCALLGDPQRDVSAVHIAGTNGKGSVAAMLHAAALAAGVPAGLYTSPHLVRPEERIRVGAGEIAPPALRALIDELRARSAEGLAAGALARQPSFFEMMTAAAFVAFARAKLGLAVLEAGLGGRLDATNVVVPRVCVITTIGMDHVKTLGPRLTDIAAEKAGIVKPGVPVVAGWLPPAALAVVARAAKRVGAPLHAAARQLVARPARDGSFTVVTPQARYTGLRLALDGAHQRRNAALAIRAAELLAARGGPAIDAAALAAGLATVRWPGRLERIDGAPRMLLDGAHNAEGARALGRHLAVCDRTGRGKRVAVFGVTAGREAAALFRRLAPHVDAVVVTRPGIDKAQPPDEIARRLAALGARVVLAPEPADALARAARLAGARGEVLVTGSLYLVGDARRILLGLEGSGHPPRETTLAPARGTR